MSAIIPPKPRVPSSGKYRLSIVAAKFNQEFTDALVENVVQEIESLAANARVDLIRVPGAFEIPVTVNEVIEQEEPDCVIALGCIIRGNTAHAELVANSVTDQLQRIAVDRKTPVIHEVLLVEDEKQAYARCIGQKLNRGREAARSALEMITIMKEVRRTNQNLRLQPSN